MVAEALRRGVPVDVISEKTSIDSYFINKIHGIIRFEKELKRTGIKGMDRAVLQRAKKMGLSDSAIARLIGLSGSEVRKMRKKWGIKPVYRAMDTAYYSAYDGNSRVKSDRSKKVVVIGSGPIRIGQGIEFDYCSVHCIRALKNQDTGLL